MATKSRFIIKRKDKSGDDIVLESEGLTIGRLPGNDLVLNHRAVDHTHAGIKEIEGEYWLFNLSNANGIVLNRRLFDQAPLADGDVAQFGPYLLHIEKSADGLVITVEVEVGSQLIDGRAGLPPAAWGPAAAVR